MSRPVVVLTDDETLASASWQRRLSAVDCQVTLLSEAALVGG